MTVKKQQVTVVGLGYGEPTALSLGAWEVLSQTNHLYFRTKVHPTVEWLAQQGIVGESFDHLYETAPDFEAVYAGIVDSLARLALEGKKPVYAVPGDPWVAERTVRLLLNRGEEAGFQVVVISSLGGLDAIYASLCLDPTDGLTILDGLNLPTRHPGQPLLITQVYSQYVASEVKLWLLATLAGETLVTVVRAAGISDQERIAEIPLYELDRLDWVDYLTSVYVPWPHVDTEFNGDQAVYPLDPLTRVMAKLRSPEGCPWDRQQTHVSLKSYMLEESYEVWDAIDTQNPEKLCDELGDLLLQVVFHAQIALENGDFDLNDIIQAITTKLIRRHPHVFGQIEVEGVGEVLSNWEAIKKAEKLTGERKSALDGVPRYLAGLAKAQKLQAKAAKVGFTWPNVQGAVAKLEEELTELKEALRFSEGALRQQKVEEELGDVLFALANLARYTGLEAEVAIHSSIAKFERRFRWIEEQLQLSNEKMAERSLPDLLQWWEKSKEATD